MTYPPLPDAPACHTWPVPMLPMPPHLGSVLTWQDGRCAICARTVPQPAMATEAELGWKPTSSPPPRAGIVEDHDHETGDTRGFLCDRCNTMEGRSNRPVFRLYRERYPTLILGVPWRKGCKEHPDVRDARMAWEDALQRLHMRERQDADYQESVRFAAHMRASGFDWPDPYKPWPLSEPKTSVELAAERMGITLRIWWDIEKLRRDLRGGSHPRIPNPLDEWRYVHRCGEYADVWRLAA